MSSSILYTNCITTINYFSIFWYYKFQTADRRAHTSKHTPPHTSTDATKHGHFPFQCGT